MSHHNNFMIVDELVRKDNKEIAFQAGPENSEAGNRNKYD